jgi:hypothetical protein
MEQLVNSNSVSLPMMNTTFHPSNMLINENKTVDLGQIKIKLNSSVDGGNKPTNGAVVDKVDQLVNVERQAVYGCPSEDFTRTANMMTALGFRFMSTDGQLKDVQPEHIPMFMILIKLSRIANCEHAFHADSWLDVKGYAKTAEIVNEKLYADQ